jgi:transposase
LEGLDPTTGELLPLADVSSLQREQSIFFEAASRDYDWDERVLLVRSRALQTRQRHRLEAGMQRLTEALALLGEPPKQGRKRYTEAAPLAAVVDKKIAEADLTALVGYTLETQKLPDGSSRVIVASAWVNLLAWRARMARLGWCVYLSNTTPAQYSDLELVAQYRHQTIQEAGFARLKTRNLHIRPVYLRDETRVSGLLWLLCLALRVLTLVEYRGRTALLAQQTALVGLSPRSPSQATTRPTTERLIEAFGNITLTCLTAGTQRLRHVPALSSLQQQILRLLQLPPDLYARLGSGAENWRFHLRE